MCLDKAVNEQTIFLSRFPCADVPSYYFDDKCITHAQSSDQREFLVKVLRIPEVDVAQFTGLWAKKLKSPKSNDAAVTLQQIEGIAASDQQAREDAAQSLRDLAFIPTKSGSFKCPQDLFDPSFADLRLLADENSQLPVGEFSTPQGIAALNAIGLSLRQSMDLPSVIKVARLIEESKDRAKALSLLRVLDRVARDEISTVGADGDESTDEKWKELMSIAWCPVLVECPFADSPEIRFVEDTTQSSQALEALREVPWKRSSTGKETRS